MADLLIPLYGSGGIGAWQGGEPVAGRIVRRALGHERRAVLGWVEKEFGPGWSGEVAVALGAQPATCFLAFCGGELAGFCCYDATYRGFFGPLGVGAEYRGRGVGRGLLHRALQAMWHAGYAYAVVGGAGSPEFYVRAAGAWSIPESSPGPYPPHWPVEER